VKTLVVATRNAHKLREIRALLREVRDLRIVDPGDVGISPAPEEEEIEAFPTFQENALAKARYFHERTGLMTVADDSGLEVDALDGLPGVRSKRFAPDAEDRSPEEQDRANIEHLLARLSDVDFGERTARFVCVAALVGGKQTPEFFRGTVDGLILGRPRGWEGFGYDPVFLDQASGRTFAEMTQEEKGALSHRGRAFMKLAAHLVAIQKAER
jgi:XTP/dITP diphosphohydrolase